jgi:integrase
MTLTSGTRTTVYLGKITKAQATTIDMRLHELQNSARLGLKPDRTVADWLSCCSAEFVDRLDRIGLLRTWDRPTACPTVSQWIDRYLSDRTDFSRWTLKGWKTARLYIEADYGNRALDKLTIADAKQFTRTLLSHGLASSTASKIVQRFKQLLTHAVDSGRIATNPFESVTIAARPNKSRQHYVPIDVAEKVLDAMPCTQMRLVFALARWSGLRVPHEPLALTWQDVDWAQNRLRISSKTKTGERTIPIVPIVRRLLDELDQVTAPGATHILTRARASAGTHWRNGLLAAIRAANVQPWEKLWINLRASCRTDMQAFFPDHVCNAWLGHSSRVAAQHYLMITSDHWQQATAHAAESSARHGARQRNALSASERH